MYPETWLNKLNRKYGRYAIPHLITYLVCGMGLVYLLSFILYPILRTSLSSLLMFDREAILHGQLWRLVTFVLIPPSSGPVFILFSLYFYWIIGTGLENQWGAFRFNAYYLCGILGTMLAGLLTGYATNNYINLSLFLAFAMIYPEHEVLLFFFLPIKVKYLAFADALYLLILFLRDSWGGKLALLVALANVALFFGNDFVSHIRQAKRRRDFRNEYNRYYR